jgi:hypothetical protein
MMMAEPLVEDQKEAKDISGGHAAKIINDAIFSPFHLLLIL